MKPKEKWIFTFESIVDPDSCVLDINLNYFTTFRKGYIYTSRVSDNKVIYITEGFTRYQVERICNDLGGRKIRNLDFKTFDICLKMFNK